MRKGEPQCREHLWTQKNRVVGGWKGQGQPKAPKARPALAHNAP